MLPNVKDIVLEHIPTQSLVVKSRKDSESRENIRMFTQGIIKFSMFAIVQFLEGFELQVRDSTLIYIPKEHVLLGIKLSKIIVIVTSGQEHAEIEISREELKTLRVWLEMRMQHCEKERDKRSKNFNPDTYIGQKFLLLDIRELLLGEIID